MLQHIQWQGLCNVPCLWLCPLASQQCEAVATNNLQLLHEICLCFPPAQFDAMRECMQRNPAVFAPLLQDVNTAVGQGQAPEGEQGPTQAAAAAAAADK